MKRSFIIGNGFDLHHGLPTRFNEFKKFFQANNPSAFSALNGLFSRNVDGYNSDNWNELENYLAVTANEELWQAALDKAIEHSCNDMDRASYWNDIQLNVQIFSQPFYEMLAALDSWIDSIDLAKYQKMSEINLASSSRFLTFNYTLTLEELYDIPSSNVLHIHGSKTTSKVLGHNSPHDLPFSPPYRSYEEYEAYSCHDDWRRQEAQDILESTSKIYYKDSERAISLNSRLLHDLCSCTELFILGWALGDQDRPYLQAIFRHLAPDIPIKVLAYSEVDKQRCTRLLSQNGNAVSCYGWNEVRDAF